jgi:RNA polymerase sigma-70 factor (ECF subfamily)
MDFLENWYVGDGEAFLKFFNNYHNMVYRTAFLITGSKEEAEDVLQEVFLASWKARQTYNPAKGKLTTWLYSITVKTATRRHRKKVFFSLEALEEMPGSFPSPEELTISRLEYQAMVKDLYTLPVKLRTVLILRYFNELSLNEISGILNIPVGTVKSRLHQGLKMLRNKIISCPRKENEDKVKL